MTGTEKFMFDTIFDELEKITPEIVNNEDLNQETPTESQPGSVQTYSEAEVLEAQKKGFSDGERKGAESALGEAEKALNDSIKEMTNKLSELQSEQVQINQELTQDATELVLTIVKKFFPTLNEKSALNEVHSVTTSFLKRLLDEPKVMIRVNSVLSDKLSETLSEKVNNSEINNNYTIISDDEIQLGNCAIEWSNGTAERNIDKLMAEIDNVISKNSMPHIQILKQEREPPTMPEKQIDSEIGAPHNQANSEFEQNINDDVLQSQDSAITDAKNEP